MPNGVKNKKDEKTSETDNRIAAENADDRGQETVPSGKGRRKFLKAAGTTLAVLAALSIAFAIYVSVYYKAGPRMLEEFWHYAEQGGEEDGIQVEIIENERITLIPDGAKAGIIFYPGAKVEYTAYLPLMTALAQKGYLCVLLKMNLNLAIFDVNAADGVAEQYPQVEEWYLAGHSLGGSIAAMYLDAHRQQYDGLILLASFSTVDFSDTDLKVFTIYGTEDRVLNLASMQKYFDFLPERTSYVIEGGCHAYFGDYGEQFGDGKAAITREEQIAMTAEYVDRFVEKGR